MKPKLIILLFCSLLIGMPSHSQILKKLKKRAEAAVERTILNKTDEKVTETTEKTIDDLTGKGDKVEKSSDSEIVSGNPALERHTQAKKAFYKEDMIIELHENNALNQTQYFDADQVAVKIKDKSEPQSGYVDSEGFMYAFDNGAYSKTSIVALQSQGMMIPGLMLEAYKLPPEPFMNNLQKQQNSDMTPNPFNGIVEFAFVYEPEQFRYEDFKESQQSFRGKSFTKFSILNEPGYEGSYVLFDDQNRLVEIYTNKKDTGEDTSGFQTDMVPNGKSLITYKYTPVEVNLPPATEVKVPGQDMLGMVFGSFNNHKNPDNSEDEYDTSASKGQVKAARTALKNNKVTKDQLPESYEFDWQYNAQMLMDSKKNDVIDMTFLIKEGATYHGMKVSDQKSKDMGNVTMLFDMNLNTMVMFMDVQGNQMLQITPIPESRETETKTDFKVTKLPSKTILNHNCEGLQIEDDKYIIKVYHTTETSLKLGNFMNFSGSKTIDLPEIDPKIIQQFSDGLIMEMQMIDKKKSKNNMKILAKSIIETPTTLNKADYKSMNFLSGANVLKDD